MIISRGLERIIPHLIENTGDYLESQDKLTLLDAGSNSHIYIRKKAVIFENQLEAPAAGKIFFARHLHKLKKLKTAGYFCKLGGNKGHLVAGFYQYVEGIPKSIAGYNPQQDIQENRSSSHEKSFADPGFNLKLYFPFLNNPDKIDRMFTT